MLDCEIKKKIHHCNKPFIYIAFFYGLNPTFPTVTGTCRQKTNMLQAINEQAKIHCNMHKFSSGFCSHRTSAICFMFSFTVLNIVDEICA
jgi:hypothetical protein